MTREDLDHNEYNAYYKNYIELLQKDASLIKALENGLKKSLSFYKVIPQEKWQYAYASGKWTILEILQHVMDTERIFAYRALCIGRGDQTPFPGFEQDDYVLPSKANSRDLTDMLEEYTAIRKSSISLFKSLSEEALTTKGMASGSGLSARAAGFIICGHDLHHANIIQERYL
ncbi:MAG: damage-inducible protein DinB [Leeuwenhoekiella sp.]|nr:MAG: damage-inducible protein DinB [Leeuwenhoekiella sp.]